MITEQMRREFEAWFYEVEVFSLRAERFIDLPPQSVAWEAWQAAIASQALQKIAEFGEEQAAQPVAVPGWKLVPVEPTPEMLRASYYPDVKQAQRKEIYEAMLEASPTQPTTQVVDARKIEGMKKFISESTETSGVYWKSYAEGLAEDFDELVTMYRALKAGNLVPLGESIIRDLWMKTEACDNHSASYNFARAIEAAHGIGPEQEGNK